MSSWMEITSENGRKFLINTSMATSACTETRQIKINGISQKLSIEEFATFMSKIGYNDTNEQIQDNIEQAPYKEVIDYLNLIKGSEFSNVKANRTEIIERYKEGYTLENFKTVIDNMVKAWTNTEYETFIRPSTLFKADKIENYLNWVHKEKKGQQDVAMPDYSKETEIDEDVDKLIEELESIL